MNPGPFLGWIAVGAAYVVVIGSLLVFMKVIHGKRTRLQARRKELMKS